MFFNSLFKSLSPHKGDLASLSSLKGSVLPLKKRARGCMEHNLYDALPNTLAVPLWRGIKGEDSTPGPLNGDNMAPYLYSALVSVMLRRIGLQPQLCTLTGLHPRKYDFMIKPQDL
jgi:hypothetical protein